MPPAVTCSEFCWPTQRFRADLIRQFYQREDTRNVAEVLMDLIRQFYQREDTRNVAEVLMDLESDDVLRVTVIGLLDRLQEQRGN